MKRATRNGHLLSVTVLDLDHFKQVNDTFGHAVGDRVFVSIAARLVEGMRSTDVIARYGGEEFAVLFPQTGRVAAAARVEALRAQVAALPLRLTDGQELTVTCSAGIAELPADGTDCVALLARACDNTRATSRFRYQSRTARRTLRSPAGLPSFALFSFAGPGAQSLQSDCSTSLHDRNHYVVPARVFIPGAAHQRRPPLITIRALVSSFRYLALAALTIAAPCLAQNASGAPPANAQASRYGGGWECVRGFRQLDKACVRVAVPENAYLDSLGNGWKCQRGYLQANDTCTAVKVPANAYAEDASYGRGWRCSRGYRELNDGCSEIKVPANAYSLDSSYGSGWECERGYRAVDGACVAVRIPPNGFLARAGNDWSCERGFKQVDQSCVAIEIPKDGYLDASGGGWKCERGFTERSSACVALKIPVDAHIDYSGNDWTCDQGHRKRGTACAAD